MKYETLAPAKINLGLQVIRRRADGFHEIETVLLRIPWADRILISTNDTSADSTLTLTCTAPGLPTDERNLCLRSARALAAYTGQSKGAKIHLDKQLPYGAGLGGGSSDAAATLSLLAEIWNLDLEEQELREIALSLGSDVPFFLGPSPALAQGRGEILTPLLDGSGFPYVLPFVIVVAVPHIHVSTAEAYSLVIPKARGASAVSIAEVVTSNDLDRWRAELINDFEGPILTKHKPIAAAKRILLDAGACYSALSGSGSAVFGVFLEERNAREAAEVASAQGHRTWWGRVDHSW